MTEDEFPPPVEFPIDEVQPQKSPGGVWIPTEEEMKFMTERQPDADEILDSYRRLAEADDHRRQAEKAFKVAREVGESEEHQEVDDPSVDVADRNSPYYVPPSIHVGEE